LLTCWWAQKGSAAYVLFKEKTKIQNLVALNIFEYAVIDNFESKLIAE